MLPNEVLNKVVLAIAYVTTIWLFASPLLQMTMTLVLMSNPVSFSLERLWFRTVGKGAGEGLHIFMHVFRPIRWLSEFLDLETQRTFKLGRQTLHWRLWYAFGKGRWYGGHALVLFG